TCCSSASRSGPVSRTRDHICWPWATRAASTTPGSRSACAPRRPSPRSRRTPRARRAPARTGRPRFTSKGDCSRARRRSRYSARCWTRSTAARRHRGRADGGPPFPALPAQHSSRRAGASRRRAVRQEGRARDRRPAGRRGATRRLGPGTARSEAAARVGARAVGGRRAAGKARPRDAACGAAAVAARLHLLLALGRAPREEPPRGCRGLSAARPPPARRRRPGGAAAGGPGVREARRVARADARGGPPRREAGPHLGDGRPRQLAAALACPPLGRGGVSRAGQDRRHQRGGRAPPRAARRPARPAGPAEPDHRPPPLPPVIVVDRVGVLADLYAFGDVAFVGGGYHRAGLHSVLEPAVFGVPVVVGPHWQMSRDAALLIERGGAVALPADGRHPLHSQWLVWHHDPAARRKA